MPSVYLNIGSNKGDRHANIERAVALVAHHPVLGQAMIRRSPWQYSEPWGYASTAEFVNLGVALDFDSPTLPAAPEDILDALLEIELTVAPDSPHRNPDGSYRDRVVDIDIIAIDGVRMDTPRLTLPHPRAEARAFVMRPMAFLCPGWHPEAAVDAVDGFHKKTIADMHRDSAETFKMRSKIPVTVVMDNIRSVNNVGSVFRTADAFRMERIMLCGITATPENPQVHKTALGAENTVAWKHSQDTLQAVRKLRQEGYTIVCLEQVHGSVSLDDFRADPGTRYALVLGNEVNGVDAAVVNEADICLEIPQEGTKHSLNVAVSGAIALWTFFSQLNKI